jgi:HAD superfamily hydrolase (TIGR01509 family)
VQRFRAALFDFDETMIDLEPQHAAASAALSRAMGSDYEKLPEQIRFASGRRILDELADMRRFFGWSTPVEELLAMRQKHFRAASEAADLALLPCVHDVVKMLHERGMILAVTSSAVGDEIDAILRRVGLRDYFTAIVDGGMVTRGKPDPEAYLVTARVLGVPPQHCVVFEDSSIGVAAAKAAGMYCIAVRSQNARFAQDLSAADRIIASFCDLEITHD